MERDGNERIVVTCTVNEDSSETYRRWDETYTKTYKEQGTMSFVIARSKDSTWGQILYDIIEGTCSSTVNTTDNGKATEYNTPVPRSQQTTSFTFSANHNEEKKLKSATTTYSCTKYNGSTTTQSYSLTSTSNALFSLSY